MKTKLFTLLLAVAASVGTMFASVTINGIAYELNGKTATVVSGGNYRGTIVIPASVTYASVTYTVTSIGDWAFYDCSSLTSIEIPNSVTSIGEGAFYDCSSLTSVTIPNSVTSIGLGAFNGCTGLPVIDNIRYADTYLVEAVDKTLPTYSIKGGTRFIGHYAFYECTGLTSVTIPNSVTSIGEAAFAGCSGLTSINVASKNPNYCSVNGVLFNKNRTTLISYPGGKQGAYSIPNSVTSIGVSAFEGCTSLTSVTIPNSVTSIGDWAFSGCSSLTSVKIPNSVTSIGDRPFQNCTSLTLVTIPNSVTSIGEEAFSDCSGLTSVTIGNSVTSIGTRAFYNCSSLTSLTIPNSVTSIGNDAFYNCSNLTSIIWNAKNGPSFNFGNQVTSFTFGDDVEVIPASICSGMKNLTSVTIGNSVDSIGENAFRGCTGLTSITCKAITPPTLGLSVFYGVKKSIPLYVPAERIEAYQAADQWKDFTNILPIEETPGTCITASGTCGAQGDNLTWELSCDSILTISGTGEMANYSNVPSVPWYSYNSSIQYVVIGNNVTSIGSYAFGGCSGLTSVTIPNSVTSIGDWAFSGCSSLTSPVYNAHVFAFMPTSYSGAYTIPDGIESIAGGAFDGCTGLTSVDIPNSVTSIGSSAFGGCSGLTSPVYNAHVFAFMPTSYSGAYTIPDGIESIAGGAFDGCTGLTSIEIPNSVTSIGSSAFGGCSGLTTMTCNAITPPSCGNIVFIGVNCSMIPLHVPEQSISVYESTSPWNGFNPIISTNKFFIKYVNWDGTEILSSEVTKGSMPQYSGATPTREATTELTYSFAGWTPEIVVATKDATYTATYNSSPRLYTITWLQDDGSLIDTTTVAYGKIPTHANPTKAETVGFTYTFTNWTPTITAVTGNATYRATYSSTRKSYTITWLNEDGSLIDKTTVEYGKTPTHANPTKAATAEFTYTFAGWTPNVVAVTGDATYTATFNSSVNKYSISATAINGSVNGVGIYPYGTQVELTAVPNYGYHFTQWSDGNTDNPRTVVLTQNMTFIAEFAVDKSGTCGKNNLLQWTFADDGTLTISGSGELTENYTFGVEAPTQMQTIIIGNEVTAIGERAFYEKTTLQKLIIGSNVTSIGKYAFASINSRQLTSLVMPAELLTIGDYAFSGNTYLESIDFNAKLQSIGAYAFKDCYRVSEMTCLATVTPNVGTDALASINSYASLCVPAECLRKYQVDPNWGRFDLCELGTTSTVTENRTVTVEPTDNTAIFTWPTENNAASYSLQITKDGVVFCTLVFNSNGQLTGIAFAPGRNGAAHAPAATMSVAGMSFTVTGLDGASKYAYRLAVTNDAREELVAYSGEFATTGYNGEVNPGGNPEGIEDVFTDEHKASKILHNGQIFILRGEKVYTVTGQEVR